MAKTLKDLQEMLNELADSYTVDGAILEVVYKYVYLR